MSKNKQKTPNKFSKEFLAQFKNTEELQVYMQDLRKALMEEMLEGELDAHLGYPPHAKSGNSNSRNGKSSKIVQSKDGTFELSVPRDREGSFEPELVQKRQKTLAEIEDKVLSLYSLGMSTRDISAQIEEIYGASISESTVSRITDRVLETVRAWQERPLESIYPIIWMDGIGFKVKSEGRYIRKVIYLVLGVNLLGHKEILGIWLDKTESASFWMKVLDDMKKRGVEQVFIACTDNLKGFGEAIQAVFPESLQQTCIVHQIRNSLKYVTWGERKAVAKDLKKIYQADRKEQAEAALLEVEEIWGAKYPHIFKSWTENWETLSIFFDFPSEIRKMIYTTNVIENVNRVIRKYTKGKTIFPSDQAVTKSVYLALQHLSKKWTMPVRNWQKIIAQLAILYPDKIKLDI